MPRRRLIIMRHGTAAGAGGGTDHSRRLTAIGHEEAKNAGARIARLSALPDRVLSSSAIRCRETFDALCGGFEIRPRVDFEDALYNASQGEILLRLEEEFEDEMGIEIGRESDARTLLLLGHNPGVSMLAFDLGSGSARDEERLRVGFAPATFAIFEIDEDAPSVSRRTVRLLHFERPA